MSDRAEGDENKKATLKRMDLCGAEWIDRSGVPPTDSRIFKSWVNGKKKPPLKKDGLGGAEWIDRAGVPATDSRIFRNLWVWWNKKSHPD